MIEDMTDNNLQVAAKNPQFETADNLEVKQRIRSILKFGQQYDIYLPGIEAQLVTAIEA